MPLTGAQITSLADSFEASGWSVPQLTLFADSLGLDLNQIAPAGSFKQRALQFIAEMNKGIPPRDRELLEALRDRGNAVLRAAANELLKPSYFSPTGDPHDAILLGKRAFVDRADLRQVLRDFTNPNPLTTRVLIVRGEEPGGKSYSFFFLQHLASSSVGARVMRLRVAGKNYTPRKFFEQVFGLLGLDAGRLPPLTDDPQLARIDALVNVFKNQINGLKEPYWLIVDDLNDPSVTPAIREAAYAVAFSVEEVKPDNLWVALLGYNSPITDDELRFAAQEEAQFPTPALAASHFDAVSKASPNPLPENRAREIADRLFEKFPKLDKEAMIKLTDLFERTSDRLRQGMHP
jgi:hypothetical protein